MSARKVLVLVQLALLTLIPVLQTYFLPVIGLVDAEKLKPGDLVVSNVVVTVSCDVGQKIACAFSFRKDAVCSGPSEIILVLKF